MKKILINHIGKTEGHNSFFGKLVNGDIAEAKLETEEGARLMEGLLNGRYYSDAPIITSRICGICPVVHNLASVKAVEDAFSVKVNEQIINLRKIMELCQLIHSHTMHLFFLSLPDFYDISDDLKFVRKFQNEAKLFIKVREFSIYLLETITGRIVHPINSETGGFRVEPDYEKLKEYYTQGDQVLQDSLRFFGFVKKIKVPKFERKTSYISLYNKNEYAIYDGEIREGRNKFDVLKFLNEIKEYQKIDEVVKKVLYKDTSYMVGSIARINNNHAQLNKNAKAALKSLKKEMPIFNPFYNLHSQAVEVINCIEEVKKLLSEVIKNKNQKVHVKVIIKAGRGIGAVEAPRGTLYHDYKFDKDGNMVKANIITPTAMFLGNLDEDLKKYLGQIKNNNPSERNLQIKTLIRAYDPCISCATH